MKKLLVFILALAMLFTLAACSSDEKTTVGSDSDPTQPPAPKGSTYDTGTISVYVPEDWYVVQCFDYSEEEPVVNPRQLQLIKDGESDFDIYTKPYIHIVYCTPDYTAMQPQKDWYENGVDMEDLVTGSHTWTAFSATTLDYPIYTLWAEEDGHKYQITIFYSQSEGAIELTDADVLEILSSITYSN